MSNILLGIVLLFHVFVYDFHLICEIEMFAYVMYVNLLLLSTQSCTQTHENNMSRVKNDTISKKCYIPYNKIKIKRNTNWSWNETWSTDSLIEPKKKRKRKKFFEYNFQFGKELKIGKTQNLKKETIFDWFLDLNAFMSI